MQQLFSMNVGFWVVVCYWMFFPLFGIATISLWVLRTPMQHLFNMVVRIWYAAWSKIQFIGCYGSIHKLCRSNPSYGTVTCACDDCISNLGLALCLYMGSRENSQCHLAWWLKIGVQLGWKLVISSKAHSMKQAVCIQIWVTFLVLMNDFWLWYGVKSIFFCYGSTHKIMLFASIFKPCFLCLTGLYL